MAGSSRVRGVGTSWSRRSLQGICELLEPRLGAIAAYVERTRVTVHGGKVDYLNLRGARLREVRFEDCVLFEPDFADAT